jgi:hypothetical protein
MSKLACDVKPRLHPDLYGTSAMPHEHPRLGAVAIGSMNGHDFAAVLERAIERSGKQREVKQIEGRAVDLTPPPGRPMEDFEARLRQLEK